MNTTNRTNYTLGLVGLAVIAFIGVTLIEINGLEMIGVVAAYFAALAIATIAGADNRPFKKLV